MDHKYGFLDECREAEAGDLTIVADLVRVRSDALLDGRALGEVIGREQEPRLAFAELAQRLEAA